MENPGSLLRRARLNRRFKTAYAPPKIQQSKQEMQMPGTARESSHANYTALMRSHDRMRTRHIPGQGGGNGA